MMSYQRETETTSNMQEKTLYRVFKRGIDIVLSLIAIILSSPILILVAFLIKKEDGKSPIFKQERSGKNNKSFYIYKFRSMKIFEKKSEEKKESPYQWENGVPDEFVFKTTDSFNPNVTKIGRFIRKTSLDELPQFFNVLKGEMSIVGPRPEIVEITRCYNEHQMKRLSVKPGITGWAQVNGRSESNHGEKIKNDLYYVEHKSLFLDLKIIAMTAFQTIFGKGAI